MKERQNGGEGNREADRRYRKEQLKRACASGGGVVQIFRTSNARMAPTTSELRMATCSARMGGELPF